MASLDGRCAAEPGQGVHLPSQPLRRYEIRLACYDFCVNRLSNFSTQRPFVLRAVLIAALAMPLRAPAQNSAAQADEIYRQGITALQQGDLATAKADFVKVVAIQPRSAEAHNSLGWVLLAQKQIDPAIAQFGAALDLRPDFFQAHMNLASAYLAKGDPKRASRSAREAIRFAPTESEAYRTLARALDASGDTSGAIKQMRKGLDLDPGRVDLHDEMGTLIVRQVSLQASTTTAAKSAPVMEEKIGGGTGPKSSTNLPQSSDADSSAKPDAAAPPVTLKDAQKEYAEALRIRPDYASAHLHLGVLQYQDKNLEEAIPNLESAVRLVTNDPQAHLYLGKALRDKGDQDGALREFAAAIKIDPSLVAAQSA